MAHFNLIQNCRRFGDCLSTKMPPSASSLSTSAGSQSTLGLTPMALMTKSAPNVFPLLKVTRTGQSVPLPAASPAPIPKMCHKRQAECSMPLHTRANLPHYRLQHLRLVDQDMCLSQDIGRASQLANTQALHGLSQQVRRHFMSLTLETRSVKATCSSWTKAGTCMTGIQVGLNYKSLR